MQDFIDRYVVRDILAWIPFADVYRVYAAWCFQNGYEIRSRRALAKVLRESGVTLTTKGRKNGLTCIGARFEFGQDIPRNRVVWMYEEGNGGQWGDLNDPKTIDFIAANPKMIVEEM